MSELNSGSSDVRRTRRNCNGPKSFKPHSMGVASISVHGGLGRDTNGLTGFDLVGGSVMWPARSNASIKPRHIMSHVAPLGWTQFQIAHSSCDSLRRLAFGCCSISARITARSDLRFTRPRYLSTISMTGYASNFTHGTQVFFSGSCSLLNSCNVACLDLRSA